MDHDVVADVDAEDDERALVDGYAASNLKDQGLINYVLISICGYSLPSLQAMGSDFIPPDPLPDAPYRSLSNARTDAAAKEKK